VTATTHTSRPRPLAVSNIALPTLDHGPILDELTAMGFSGIEVAPTRAWARVGDDSPTAAEVDAYRKRLEAAGLRAVGLHSLFYGQSGMSLFSHGEDRQRTLDFLGRLAAICRDLGGRTLIFGSPPARRRGTLAPAAADDMAAAFFADLSVAIESLGVCVCLEPLGPDETDFVNRVEDALRIVRRVNHPAFRCQIDAKALVANSEADRAPFIGAWDVLAHYHANEPDLLPLGTTGRVDHAALGGWLADVGYDGWVSLEMRMPTVGGPAAIQEALSSSAALMRECYP